CVLLLSCSNSAMDLAHQRRRCSQGWATSAIGAQRTTFPLTLVDMDDLSDRIVAHYENFDLEGRALLPLIRVFWPPPDIEPLHFSTPPAGQQRSCYIVPYG